MSTEVILDMKKEPNKITFGTTVVTFITDPFNPITSRQISTDLHGRTLDTYLKGYCLGAKYLVRVNGNLFEGDYTSYVVQPNDNIVYVSIIAGGGGGGGAKQIITIVAMIALTIVAPYATAALIGTMGTAVSFTGFMMLQGLVFMAGALLINSILAPDVGASGIISTPEVESSTYSWTGIQTSRDINTAIPVLYGTHALGGTVINNRFYYRGSDDWLAIQLALCHGEIERITSDNIKIQDATFSSFVGNPIGSDGYFDSVSGTLDQPIMSGFDDSIYNNGSVARQVKYNTPYTFVTESTNIDFFRIHFEFPKGLYTMNSQGIKSVRTTNIEVKYRKVGTSSWSYLYDSNPVYVTEYKYYNYDNEGGFIGEYWSTAVLGSHVATRQTLTGYSSSPILNFNSSSSVAFKEYFEPSDSQGNVITLVPGQYEFHVTRISADDLDTDVYNVSDSHVRFIEEINSANINYGGIALLGVNIKATDQLSSQRPNIVTTVTRKPMYLAGAYRDSTNPAWICYDILTNKHYGMGLNPSKLNTIEFTRWAAFCDGIINNTFTISSPASVTTDINTQNGTLVIPKNELPTGETLTSTSLRKTLSNFSGTGTININGIAIDVPLNIDNISSITMMYEQNHPIRVDGYYYYISFTHPIKLGSSFLYTLVSNTRETEATPKLSFNGVFDTTSDIWTALQEVAKIGRGQVILQGTKYSCIYDAKKTIAGLYNSVNSNNVVVNYINQADIASELELQYTDKSIGYEMTSISVQDASAITSNTRSNKASQTVKGITTESEALVYGRYMLATSKFIRRVVTLDADIESITQTVGDLIAVQTDVTQYGVGGSVKSRLGSVVILDETVYLEIGREYTLKIKRINDDFVKDYNFIANVVEPVNFLSFDSMQNTPVGAIKFDDLSLLVYEVNNNFISTESLFVPDGYEISPGDRYSFGLKGSDSILCIITDISRDGDLTRKITAAEYNESILDFDYDNDVIQRLSPTIKPKNTLSNLVISDRLVKAKSGSAVAMMSFAWDSTVSSYYNFYIMEGSFKNYLAMGVKSNRFEYPSTELVPEVLYRIYIEDALDMGVVTYKDYIITSFSSPPEDITNFTATPKGNSIYFNISYPNEPLDFSYYEVYLDGSLVSKQISNQFSILAQPNKINYEFKLVPVDTIGKKGNPITKNLTIASPTIEAISYTQEKEYIKFDIQTIASNFSIDRYEFSYTGHIGSSKESTLSIIADWVGSTEFSFKVYDVMGNISDVYLINVNVTVPTPRNLVSLIDIKDAVLRWDSPLAGLPVDYFEVEYDNSVYKTKSNQYRLPVYWGGTKTFNVRAVNTLGAVSDNVSTSITIEVGSMTVLKTEVIDNNVLLRWSSVQGSLPIENFMLYRGATELTLETIGEKKGTFTTIFENSSGVYTYWMAPIDSAGNIGNKLSATTMVNQPPDYVLNVDWYSTYSGTLSNAKLEGSSIYLPINITDSITSHFTSNSWLSAEEQVLAGYPIWTEPFEATGSYTEVFDYGTVLASSMVSINLDKTIIKGTPNVIITVSLSTDGVTYTDYYDQSQVYGTGFRYVKLLIEVSGTNSLLKINSINLRLDSKLVNDGGTSEVTNAATGVVVNFNPNFVDIISIQVTPTGTTPAFAIYDFTDTPNPTFFTVYLYNPLGQRITGKFSWGARGY